MLHLDVGLLTAQRLDGSDQPWADLYADTLAIAEEAERLGFDGVWVSEHHFTDDGYMSAVLPVLAAIAARTERVALGTNVALAPLYHPLRLAEDAAAVDLISGGRLLLGLAIGYRDAEFDAVGVAKRGAGGPARRVCRACAARRGRETPSTTTGRSSRHAGSPSGRCRRDRRRSGWAAGSTRPSNGRRRSPTATSRRSACSTTPAGGSRSSTRRPTGPVADPLPVATATWLSLDRGDGLSPAVERGVRHLYTNYEQWYSSSSDGGGGRAVGEMIAGLAGFATGEAPPGVVTGSAQEVVDVLAPLAEIGRERTYRMALRVHYPGMDRAEVLDHLAALAEDVAPSLRAAAS